MLKHVDSSLYKSAALRQPAAVSKSWFAVLGFSPEVFSNSLKIRVQLGIPKNRLKLMLLGVGRVPNSFQTLSRVLNNSFIIVVSLLGFPTAGLTAWYCCTEGNPFSRTAIADLSLASEEKQELVSLLVLSRE